MTEEKVIEESIWPTVVFIAGATVAMGFLGYLVNGKKDRERYDKSVSGKIRGN